jgi:hypothetical protein
MLMLPVFQWVLVTERPEELAPPNLIKSDALVKIKNKKSKYVKQKCIQILLNAY